MNDGMPVWHVSVAVTDRRKGRLDTEVDWLERVALAELAGVGGEWERWRFSPGLVGHLHVPTTAAEQLLIVDGLVTTDAGETGPERPRSPDPGAEFRYFADR